MNTPDQLPHWDEVKVSFVDGPDSHPSPHRPVLIEPVQFQDSSALNRFIASHSEALKSLINTYGSIIFRGFSVFTENEYEAALLSVESINPMQGYFLQEEGRDRIAGTSYVFATNTKFKTGGGFELDNFHSENFFSPDVPALQSFWCKVASPFGGQTALVQSANAYNELSPSMRERLEKDAVRVVERSIAIVAADNNLTEPQMLSFLDREGLDVVQSATGPSFRLVKPPVLTHPDTGRNALQVHLSFQSPRLNAALRKRMITAFQGPSWLVHRLYWKGENLWAPVIEKIVRTAFNIEQRLKMHKKSAPPKASCPIPNRFGADFTDKEVEHLADAIWKHTYLHTWQRGDIFIFDNLQTLHGGLPGVGERTLRVMLCDPIRLPVTLESGLFSPPKPSREQPTVWQNLQKFKRSV